MITVLNPPCSECGRPTDPRDPFTHFEIVGWAARRRRGGGLHHFKFKRETGKLMCDRCVRTRRQTGTAQQESFL